MRFSCALVAAVLLVARISAERNLCGIEDWQSAIDESCSSNDAQATQRLILNASTCAFSPEFHQELRIYTPYAYLNDTLQPSPGKDYNASFIELVIGTSKDTLNATEELNRDILSYYDGFVLEAEFLPEFAQANVVAPLDQAIISEPELSWYQVSRYYRGFSVPHEAKAYGVPLGGAGAFTFYRQDLFQRFNITVPTTWEGLLATARHWNETQPVPGIAPFCMSHRSQCARTLVLSIAAPYLQSAGTREGFLIDPANGTLLLNSSGFAVALRTWQQLNSLATVDDDASCTGAADSFSAGKCLMTVQQFLKFKVYASDTSSVHNVLGVALTPGSAVVVNRTTGSLQQCTQVSCPYAVSIPETDAWGADDDGNKASGAPTGLANRAQFMWGGLVGLVTARNPSGMQDEVIRYFTDLTFNRSLENVLRKDSRMSPFRVDHWSAAAKLNWTDAGYADAAVVQMMEALQRLHVSPNLAPQLRLPGQEDINHALNAALADLAAGQVVEEVADALQNAAAKILLERYGMVNGTVGYLKMYRQQLGYVKSSISTETPRSRRSAVGVSRQTVVVIAVVIGLVSLLASVVVLEVRNKRRHKDLLGRVKPPLGDPDTTIVVASIQDFDELWEALISDASERALMQFSELVDSLLRRHSGYRAPSEEEDVVVAFHNPRDACEFARELQRGLLELHWPKHVLEMEQFRPQHLAQNKRATSFSQSYNGARAPMSPLSGPMPAEDEDKLFTLDTGAENVRSFGEQCVASWTPAEASTPESELVFSGIRACVGVCSVGFSRLELDMEPGHKRYNFMGEAVEVAAAAAAAAQGGMVLIPQSTFRQLHLEVLAEQCLFCHLGEYQLTAELPPMDLYLALDRQLLGRLALFGPLACHMQWSQGAFAAPVHSASMVFTHVVGVQTLLAWDYDLMQEVIETFTKLAQVELQQAGGYLVEHVEGFMLTAFHSPADAILWGLRMQELMLKEDWPEELLAHELCEEVTVTVPVRGGEVTSATVFRGPRLKTGIDIGQVLARLHTMTGRMTYRGKVMNRAARISAAASSGQVLCSSEAWESCTASASALRLVTATSLGLFQLKGIQERIEVFHCTYQRHMPSSTRRSSAVSVGLVSSSDNRRKSAVAGSSLSHISHHTTSYRTSLHNSIALDHVSSSDATGGRRGSQASAAAPPVGQLSDMLHLVGGADAAAGAGNSPAAAMAAIAAARASLARYRAAPVPVVVGEGGGAVAVAGCVSQTGSSHRSQGSAASGAGAAGVLASRAALAAVLQSRTRSASALQANSSVSLFRSASARARRPLGLPGVAVASEPQISLAAAQQSTRWNAGMATSPSATPSLAIATAAAAAAAHERTTNCATANINASTNSPKAAAMLDMPRGTNANAIDSASTHSTSFMALSGLSGATNADSAATVTAAVYAVLPSVVLSAGGISAASHGGMSPGMHDSNTHEARGRSLAAAGLAACVAEDTPPNDLQMATIATCVEDIVQLEEHSGSADATSAADDDSRTAAAGDGPRPAPQPPPMSNQHQQQVRHVQVASSSSPPFVFERVSPLGTLQEDSPPPAAVFGGGDTDMEDDGSHVETLEVTVSATGIVRGALSGAASSTGFGATLGSSQGASISRCGSATIGISYLALGLSGGLGSSPAGIGGAGGAGASSQPSSCASSGFGNVSYTNGPAAAARPQSAAVWRASMSLLASPQLAGVHGLAGAAASAAVRRSGSVNSGDLFLPFPLGANGGGAGTTTSGGGGTAESTSSGLTAAMAAGLQQTEGQRGSGGAVSGASSRGQGRASDAVVADAAAAAAATVSAPVAVPQRQQGAVHSGRLTVLTTAQTAVAAAAGGRTAQTAGAGPCVSRQVVSAASAPSGSAAGTVLAEGSLADAALTARASTGNAATPTEATGATGVEPTSRIMCLGAVRYNAGGSGDTAGRLISVIRTNSSVAVAATAAATAASTSTSLPSACHDGGLAGGGSNGGRLAGRGGGSGSGRLRLNNGPVSGISNDLPSQAVSPCSTWASGGSAYSTTTIMPGTVSISPVTASGVNLEQHQLHHQQLLLPQRNHESLRALLDDVGGVSRAPSAATAAATSPEAVLQFDGSGHGDRGDDAQAAGPEISLAGH